MKNLFDPSDFEDTLKRAQDLKATSHRHWGKMNIEQMICHVSDAFRDILGFRKLDPVTPPEMWPKILEMVLVEKEWDHDLPTFPPYLQGEGGGGTAPTNFDDDKITLLELMTSFHETPEDFAFYPHAGLGFLTREQAGKFVWKHTDHHLRQFGV